MVQNFPFSGFLNYDDPDEVMPVIHNRDTRNIQFRGTAPNLRGENLPGTREKVNPFLIDDGNNLTIGRYYDANRKRIFTFNYRGDDNKAIYMYDTVGATWYRIVEQTVNAETDVLGFTQSPIINIDIIYGDSSQGDILCFIDSFGVPKKVNIDRALSGGYGTIQKSYLDVAKEPAGIPPDVAYEYEIGNSVNNLRKKLFRFKIRWVFDDQDKSVTSSQSEMPLPFAANDQSVDSNPEANCRIAITYQTGPANVKKIELLAAVSIGNTMSDFFLIESIDKDVSGVPDNEIATYLFYNNKAYNYIDVQESIQLFDYVPQLAGAQTLLNGNVLSYGKVTEGYPNLTNFSFGGFTSNLAPGQVPHYYGITFSTLTASQNGNSGFGTGDIHIIVRGIILSLPFLSPGVSTYTIYMTDGTDISYSIMSGDDAAAIIEGLRVDAISKGYTVISVGANDLIVQRANTSLAREYITSSYDFNVFFNSSLYAYDWLGSHGYGLVYFDDKERTNGVVYTSGFSVKSNSYNESGGFAQKPSFTASIYHAPPVWGTHYQWVRTKDLKKSSFQQWISDRTFKDNTPSIGNTKYAYISIESLMVFVARTPGTPLGYTYTPGDRITFFKRFNDDNTTGNLYFNSKDFEIVGTDRNPTINGQVRNGTFVKIVLPATDGNFDFGTGFNVYFIEMYTPAQSVANGLDVYYEYGERYAIGNPGESNAFHQGMTQNQIPNTTTPATFLFINGDFYSRLRSVETGNEFLYTIPAASITNAQVILIGIDFISNTYADSNITTQSIAYVGQPVFDPFTDSRWHIRAIDITTFHVTGTVVISFDNDASGTWDIYLQNRYGEKTYIANSFDASGTGVHSFVVDLYITLEDDRLFLLAAGSSHRDVSFSSTNITYTVSRIVPQVMIDDNFSDYFPSAVNSNGRAYVFDENANQVTFPVMYRWSLDYQADTNINQSNRFYPQNLDSVDRRFGEIRRMMTWDRLLTFFQDRKCGQVGIYQKFITDSAGSQQLITTTSIITDNNVQYYAGNFGVGNQPDSIVQSGYVFYFVDPIKSKLLRLSRDGITDLSETYKTQTWAAENIPAYLTDRNYTYGGIARITGTFNVRKDNTGEYLCVLQPWTFGSESFAGETMAFDEGRNYFTAPYDYAPEQIVCAENVLYSFRNGKMYIHDVITAGGMNRFYGTYYDPTVTRVFNAGLIEKKSFLSLTEVASTIWDCPEITTNVMSYGTTPQQSNLITQDFVDEESNFSASFLGDVNSVDGLYGDTLKGNLIKIKFRAPNATSLVTLSAVNLAFIDSPFTNR
jgi:hypothetical protein